MPVAVTVGGLDTSVPPDSVRRLVQHWQKLGKKDVLMIDRPKVGHETNYDDTVTALEFVIKAAAAKKPAARTDKKAEPAKKAASVGSETKAASNMPAQGGSASPAAPGGQP